MNGSVWTKIVETSSGCWEWRGSFQNGYGVTGKKYVHRLMWEMHHGPITEGLFVLHKCDNRKCSNPSHLFLGSQLDNMRDMRQKKRGTMGETHPNAKLSDKQCEEIRLSYNGRGNPTMQHLADKYGVAVPCISRVIARKRRPEPSPFA